MKKKLAVRHIRHEAHQQHNQAPRLEGVVKNKGIKPVHKEKVVKLFPEWLMRAQHAAQTVAEAIPEELFVATKLIEA